MNLCILSTAPKAYSTRRLVEAGRIQGHKMAVRNTLDFSLLLEPRAPGLLYRGKKLPDYDAIIPRIGSSITFYGTAVVRQFEQMGAFSINGATSISVARDKLRSLQILSRHDIGIASTAFVREKREILPAIERMGGAPVIIKLLEGTQGVGVILAETSKVAETIIETLQSTRQNVLIQRFVSESRGKDIRALVIGDRVVAAMRRRAVGSEFRSNVHRGGSVEAVTLDEHYERTAVRAAQIIGLRVAGVDMLEGAEGPVIMEVNSSPGLEGIERASGKDLAGEIVSYIDEHQRFGDPDIRQRLSFAKGYAVSEFTVPQHFKLCGKPLSESGLKERGIVVMSINRGSQPIPGPGGDDIVQAGDTLLCYGPKLALREYIPVLSKKRVRKKKTNTAS